MGESHKYIDITFLSLLSVIQRGIKLDVSRLIFKCNTKFGHLSQLQQETLLEIASNLFRV
jgi:hypothetical protein